VAEHVRVRPGDPHASGLSQVPQAAGGGVAVHPGAAAVEQDRAAGAGADGAVDGPPDGSFDPDTVVDFREFEDVLGRNFAQPAEGLGFDGSPAAHM
jgi:hypothetical protein